MESLEADPLSRLRALLSGLLAFGLVGTGAELLLIGHFESLPQLAPLGAIALALAALVHRGLSLRAGVSVLRAAMVALIACGLVGVVAHHQGAREFQRELDPSIGGFSLLLKSLQAKTPPALAPGNLVLFGLLGLASTYKESVGAAVASTQQRNPT